jgi:hypothetical protein
LAPGHGGFHRPSEQPSDPEARCAFIYREWRGKYDGYERNQPFRFTDEKRQASVSLRGGGTTTPEERATAKELACRLMDASRWRNSPQGYRYWGRVYLELVKVAEEEDRP